MRTFEGLQSRFFQAGPVAGDAPRQMLMRTGELSRPKNHLKKAIDGDFAGPTLRGIRSSLWQVILLHSVVFSAPRSHYPARC
jgi:hypothetical protein